MRYTTGTLLVNSAKHCLQVTSQKVIATWDFSDKIDLHFIKQILIWVDILQCRWFTKLGNNFISVEIWNITLTSSIFQKTRAKARKVFDKIMKRKDFNKITREAVSPWVELICWNHNSKVNVYYILKLSIGKQ